MKQYILDANVVFSAIISGDERYPKMFATYKFFVPDFALREIQKYQQLILQKTDLKSEQIRDFTLRLFSNLTVVPNLLISTNSYFNAFQICKDVDVKDISYIALSLEFDIEFITKDEELIQGVRARGFQKIISLKEFFDQIE